MSRVEAPVIAEVPGVWEEVLQQAQYKFAWTQSLLVGIVREALTVSAAQPLEQLLCINRDSWHDG